MKDLFLHDSLDASPIVFSDRILYTPTSFATTLGVRPCAQLRAYNPAGGNPVK